MDEDVIAYLQTLASKRLDALDAWLERQLPYIDIDLVNDDFDISIETIDDGTEKLTLYKLVPLRTGQLELKYIF